jgi:hypothetical protein
MREGDSMFIKYVLGNWRGKWPLGISKPGWEDSIKAGDKGVDFENLTWI